MRDYNIPNPLKAFKKKKSIDKTPMAMVKEIKDKPSPKGTLQTTIWGVPFDLHALEEFIPKISPHVLRTIVRNDRAITLERMKNYAPKGAGGVSSKTVILILVAVGLAIGGVIMLMFMPDIMAFFQQGAGGV